MAIKATKAKKNFPLVVIKVIYSGPDAKEQERRKKFNQWYTDKFRPFENDREMRAAIVDANGWEPELL